MRKLVLLLALVLIAAYAPPRASAQGQPAAQPGGKSVCPLEPCTVPQPRGIDIADAKKMAAAAAAEVAFAVVDANGDLVYFERMDGAHARAVTSAMAKARAAVLFGANGRQLAEAASAGQPVNVTITTPAVWAWEINLGPGALPILKNGKVVAGFGVGGARPNAADKTAGKFPDEEYAKAGVAAIAAAGYSTK
jgi:glc operon protein GlcG